MAHKPVRVKDQGRLGSCKSIYGTAMAVLYEFTVRWQGEDLAEGKVSAAEMPDGELFISVSTSVSNVSDHGYLLGHGEIGRSVWTGGAYFKVDWPTGTLRVYGSSYSLGPLPDAAVSVVRSELQRLLEEFLQAQKEGGACMPTPA